MFKHLGLVIVTAVFSASAYAAAPEISYGIHLSTETSGPNGQLVPTQEAYTPESKITLSDLTQTGTADGLEMASPEDMYLDSSKNTLYVADTGNNRALAISLTAQTYQVFGLGELRSPTGIYATSSWIYVADKGNATLDIYAKDTLTRTESLGRPGNALFGSDTPYVPLKVAASDKGDVYLVSEGCTKGILQLSDSGEFVGYIGANETSGSVTNWFKKLLGIGNTTGFLKTGAAPTNLCLDSKGLVYTVTNKATANTVKKLNTNGVSILSPTYNQSGTIQAAVDKSDNIYTVQETGSLTIYDSYGNLLFTFTSNDTDEILGTLAQPMAVQVDEDKAIYVLDKEYGMITRFVPTEFANLVYQAEDYYKDGLYLQGEDSWKAVLKANSMFILAYKALARASMKKKDYQTALTQFEKAEDKQGYSEAYWEIRNTWLQANLGYVMIGIFAFVLLVVALKVAYRKKPLAFAGVTRFREKCTTVPVVKDVFHMKQFYFHVKDGVYETKYHGQGSLIFAIVLYVWFVAIQILSVTLKGYLFNSQNLYDSRALEIILVTTLPLLGLVLCNYFVATVTDGEGRLRDCFISYIYALTPYLVLALPIFLISRVLTYNESVVYNTLIGLVYVWCGINVFLTVEELHDYSFGQAVKNILLTLFAFFMLVLFVIVIYMLGYQLVNYFGNLIREGMAR